jgi:small subunit ribosomal protein S16
LLWIQRGAQPSDTMRDILSDQGVMLMHHLVKGVKKGALNDEQAQQKFDIWKSEKQSKENNVAAKKLSKAESEKKARLENEAKLNAERAQQIAKRNSDLAKQSEKQEETAEVSEETTEA